MGSDGVLSQRICCFQHHTIGHFTAFGQNGAKTQTWEDKGVVALADVMDGLPEVTIARPSLQSMVSPGSASQAKVGLDSGKMRGWVVLRAIACTTE